MEPSDIVLHHSWNSRADLAALALTRQELERHGLRLSLAPMPDAGTSASHDVRQRLFKMHGQQVLAAGGQGGALADLSGLAGADTWQAVLSPAVLPFMQVDGGLHGVPVALHKSNCAWFSGAALRRAGVAAPPADWPAFNAMAARLLDAGVAPLALGGQDWQVGNLFENVLLGLGGTRYYRRVMAGQDLAALDEAPMLAAFRQMRMLSTMVDPAYRGRDWESTAALVAQGQAAMQIMGDWARHPCAAAMQAGEVLYQDAPGTQGCFVFIADFFAVAAPRGGLEQSDQLATLAAALMQPSFQRHFCAVKGALPARMDIGPETGNALACAIHDSHRHALRGDAMLGSLTYQQAAPDPVRDAMLAVAFEHFTSAMRDDDAVRALATSVRGAPGA